MGSEMCIRDRSADAQPSAAAAAATAARRLSSVPASAVASSSSLGAGAQPTADEAAAAAALAGDEAHLARLLHLTERLLAPAFAQLEAVLAPSADEQLAPAPPADRERRASLNAGRARAPADGGVRTHLLLCADEELAALPLEGLTACTRHHVGSVCRDFSLAFAARRLGALARADGSGGGNVISSNTVGFCADPLGEAEEVRAHVRAALLGGADADVAWAATGKVAWAAQLDGSSAPPSTGEWERALEGSSLFVYSGLGRLLSYVPPEQVAALVLDRLGVALICDQLHTQVRSGPALGGRAVSTPRRTPRARRARAHATRTRRASAARRAHSVGRASWTTRRAPRGCSSRAHTARPSSLPPGARSAACSTSG